MAFIETKELLERLQGEFAYPKAGAEMVASKIMNLQPALRDDFVKWWKSGEIPVLEIEGISMSVLLKQHKLNPIGAFLTLDWLIREPEKAAQAIARGYDKVNFTKKPE